jgi:ketosteroid isomerase-like protein
MDDRTLARLNEAADRAEIENLLGRYCRAIDRCDVELLRSVYHPDAVDDHGAMKLNAHEFAQQIVDMLGALCEHTINTVTHSVIEVRGDTATSESYYLATHSIAADEAAIEKWFGPAYLAAQRAAGTLSQRHEYVCIGRYLDELSRRDGAWRISRRRITNEWGSSRPESSVREGIPAAFAVTGRRDRQDPVYGLEA